MIPWLIRLVTGARARWVGIDPIDSAGEIPQRIYFANHTSNLDAPVIWASLPPPLRRCTRPVAAKDYWEAGPIRNWLATRIFNAVLIERRKVTARSNPMLAMQQVLTEGGSLIIFPEGTRSVGDDVSTAAFKPGLWHLARKHPSVQLVPVHLENLNRIMPKGNLLIVPLMASVTFGAPIQFRDGEPRGEFLDRARQAVDVLRSRGEAAPPAPANPTATADAPEEATE